MSDNQVPGPVQELIDRSNRLGADRRNTNYGGGNTSAKGAMTDPTSGTEVEVMWVKGSGGDLGTLQPSGLSTLRLDMVRSLKDVYRGVEHEDEMHQLLDYCSFGPDGAAPSIDTSMHGLIEAKHVDHLHPDSVIAIAAASDGEALTKRCFGDDLGWVPWRRPGFELALEIEELRRKNQNLRGVVMGGHGLTTWAETSDECERTSLEMIARASRFLTTEGDKEPLGPIRDGFGPLGTKERRETAAELAPFIRKLASTDGRVVGRWFDDDSIVDFIGRNETPRVVPLGTSCPDHFIRTKVRPLLLDLPATASLEERKERLTALHEHYREDYRAYYQRYADEGTPPMRGADPAIFLIPGVGMFSFGSDSQTARVAGEFYVNAMNVIKGAESVSTYEPVPESEKFKVEYWMLEELKLRRRPAPKPLTGKVALVTGAGSGIGRAIAIRLREAGAVVAVVDIDAKSARDVADEIGREDAAIALGADVTSDEEVARAFDETVVRYGGVDIVVNNAGLSLSKSLLDTTEEDWDLQHDVMAKGSFLVSKHAALAMITQERGGDLVYIVSKNAVVAGPNNLAYGSAKASQAHQVRLLAAELGEHGIRVNGINPDGVVQGSGIFAGGWGADRAKVYGVPEEKLGEFYAGRTLLKQEVLPEHVANAVIALVAGELSQTTGLIVPVDSGVVPAFLR
ncbi:MAG TPA: bifunctional rhamnulose-1-phosphate aldolase/short-chain dehydrogenase [Acidimicrobiia bacterium]|nr:bifunctional rhamnulose-1-phosphate aldolase/short-chain dehydrogenase [Acidimicrobiia bacterium]